MEVPVNRRILIRIGAVGAGAGFGWLWSYWQTCSGST